jgi:hypothetical protein
MDKHTDETAEKESPERVLGALLLEGLESGEATALTRADFDKIKDRGVARLKAEKSGQNRI